MTGAQDQIWYQILNPVLRDTNQGMDGICSNTADASLSDFFRQEEKNKEVDEGEGESDEASVNGYGSRMDEEGDSDTLENGEQALEHSVRTKLVTRPHEIKGLLPALSYKPSIS